MEWNQLLCLTPCPFWTAPHMTYVVATDMTVKREQLQTHSWGGLLWVDSLGSAFWGR